MRSLYNDHSSKEKTPIRRVVMATATKQVKVVSKEEVAKPIALAEAAGVRPQMIYNYIRSGRLESFKGQIEGEDRVQLLIPQEVAEKWLTTYLERKAARRAAAEAEAEETADATE
jgi:hypothetical protein